MRIPLFAVAFVCGACLMHSGILPLRWNQWESALALAPLAVLTLPLPTPWRPLRIAAVAAMLLAAGFLWADFRADLRLQKRLPQNLVWKDILVEGEILDLPRRFPDRVRFDFRIEKIRDNSGNQISADGPAEISSADGPAVPPLVARLSDYHREAGANPDLRNGAKLRMKIRVRPPRVSANPHGFEYGDFLFANDIQLQGYVRDRESVTVLVRGESRREKLRKKIMATDSESCRSMRIKTECALLAAFVVGDRSGIPNESYEVLRRTGIAHLVSVSGAHIALAAGFAALLTSLLWRRSRRLTAVMPAGKAALLAALPLALGYALLAGFGIPVRRSFLMLAVASLVVLSGRTPAAAPGLALAALVIVVADPWAVVSPGFWMSFALVAAVIFAFAGLGPNPVRSFARMQILVSVFAAPLTLLFFNQASLASPLANLIAVPVVGFAILPMALADVLLPGDWLWTAAGFVLQNLWRLMEWISDLKYAAWHPAAAPWWLFAAAAVGGAWTLAPAGTPFKWAGLFPVAAMMLWNPPPPPDLRAVFLNAGQGTAVVVRAGEKTLLYDAGPFFAGRLAVAPFLRGEGIRKLDAMVVSHDDSDHRGGADDILRVFAVEKLFASFRMESGGVESARCEAGTGWEWDGIRFAFLHPRAADYDRNFSDNAMSCVLKIESERGSVLLTGDIPGETEFALAGRLGARLDSDVLLAAHHGSRHSTTDAFLDLVSPGHAIFSAGANNRFGHPHPDVLSRSAMAGAEILRTDRDGAIVVDWTKDGIRAQKWRERRAYRWEAKADRD